VEPFDKYPDKGLKPIRRLRGTVARHGHAREVLENGGFACAYCGLDMTVFEGWLQLSVDHVIPQQMVTFNWNPDWVLDEFNVVACCRPCNDLFNRDPVLGDPPASLEEFIAIRDRVFADRRVRILERRAAERDWFDANVTPLTKRD
jgi:hypothetical protein